MEMNEKKIFCNLEQKRDTMKSFANGRAVSGVQK